MLAKFTNLFLALPNPPGELIKILDKTFYKFLWNNGPDRVIINSMKLKEIIFVPFGKICKL